MARSLSKGLLLFLHPEASSLYQTAPQRPMPHLLMNPNSVDVRDHPQGASALLTVYVASLADIALVKALAYQDLTLDMMGEMFAKYRFTQSEIEVISEVVETKVMLRQKDLMQVARTATYIIALQNQYPCFNYYILA